jgi:tetratricopeptide (TPR) repeat protein
MNEISPLFALEAEQLLLAGYVDDALELCKQGIEIYPEYASAYGILAKAFSEIGDMEFAIATISSALERFPLNKSLINIHKEITETEKIIDLRHQTLDSSEQILDDRHQTSDRSEQILDIKHQILDGNESHNGPIPSNEDSIPSTIYQPDSESVENLEYENHELSDFGELTSKVELVDDEIDNITETNESDLTQGNVRIEDDLINVEKLYDELQQHFVGISIPDASEPELILEDVEPEQILDDRHQALDNDEPEKILNDRFQTLDSDEPKKILDDRFQTLDSDEPEKILDDRFQTLDSDEPEKILDDRHQISDNDETEQILDDRHQTIDSDEPKQILDDGHQILDGDEFESEQEPINLNINIYKEKITESVQPAEILANQNKIKDMSFLGNFIADNVEAYRSERLNSKNPGLIPGLEFSILKGSSRIHQQENYLQIPPEPPPFPNYRQPIEQIEFPENGIFKELSTKMELDEQNGIKKDKDYIEQIASRLENYRRPKPIDDKPVIPLSTEPAPMPVSETIASIYEMQGAFAQAMEAYTILTEQNPDKIEFYNSKINDLKKMI